MSSFIGFIQKANFAGQPDVAPVLWEPALQVVGSRGEIHLGQAGARTAANNLQVARTRHYVGQKAVTEISFVFQDYYVPDTLVGEVAGNGYTANFNVEYNGVSVRGAFGGARDGVVPAGSAWFPSDSLPASAFGLSEFPANAEIWFRGSRIYAVGAVSQFQRTTAFPITITGERYMSAAAGTNVDAILDATGVLVTGGGWTAQTHVWVPLCMLGMPVAPMMAVGASGASIEQGVSDSDGDGSSNSGGYFRRALFDFDGAGKKIARMSIARSSETAAHFILNNTKRLAIAPYLTHLLMGYGGGDYTAGSSWTTTKGRQATGWAQAKTAGAPWVGQISMSPKTNSTDAFATVANQTPRTGWAIGAEWYNGNAELSALVGVDPNLDGFMNIWPSQVDAVATDKWKAPPAHTSDGTHPNATMSALMAVPVRSYLETLRLAHEG